MKKLFSLLFVASLFAACGNDATKSSSETDSTSTMNTTRPVDNVNGNVPDTTNSVSIHKPLPIDSSKVKDSTQR